MRRRGWRRDATGDSDSFTYARSNANAYADTNAEAIIHTSGGGCLGNRRWRRFIDFHRASGIARQGRYNEHLRELTMKVDGNSLSSLLVGVMLLRLILSCAGRQSSLTSEGTNSRNDRSAASDTPSGADSGIYGQMVAAWSNPPANPPTYECIKVLDATGQTVVAAGTCSGIWGQFRVPLPPGR